MAQVSQFGVPGRGDAYEWTARLVHSVTVLLKALWGGHTAALQFMLGIQLQVGERKHAMRHRRLQEDDIIRTCMRCILQVVFAVHTCAMWVSNVVSQQEALKKKKK